MPTILVEEDEPVNILYFGTGGSGKTTDIMHLAKLGKVWAANAESGIKARALKQFGIPLENIEIFPDPNNPKEELTYEGLEGEWKRIREALHEDPTAYVATCWDSMTEVQQTMKDVEVARSIEKANRRGQQRDPFVVDQDNWRTINEQCRALIRKFRDLPVHFSASALQRREQDHDGRVIYMPSVTPGLQGDLIGWFDLVCHTETIIVSNEIYYMGDFSGAGKFESKDRFHMLPKKIVNPTHDRVIAYVDGDLTIETDDEMQALKAAVQEANSEAVPA